jgi:hypothetical protein
MYIFQGENPKKEITHNYQPMKRIRGSDYGR